MSKRPFIKVAHEAPITAFHDVQSYTDIDYALVHLIEENPKYRKLFEEAIAKGREVILDNSIFELGESFDEEKYLFWINKLDPTWYIIPDVLESRLGTAEKAKVWKNLYEHQVTASSKKIGVVQGTTYDELSQCYWYMDELMEVDMIAISFDYSWYEGAFPHPNKYVSWMLGRVHFLSRMLSDGLINEKKPHHLLGASLPQEGMFYNHPDYSFIHSIDTSNPVVHGLFGIEYPKTGLWSKHSKKLFELIDHEITEDELDRVLDNITAFGRFWNPIVM